MNGNGPSAGYMAQLQQSMAMPADSIGPHSARFAPPPAATPYGAGPPPTAEQLGFAPSAPPQPKTPDLFGSAADTSLAAFARGEASAAPAPPPPNPAPAGAPGPAPGPVGNFPLTRIGGGGVVNVPAKETEMRGPTLRAAQSERNAAIQGAIDAVNERSQQTAAQDFAVALQQQKRAQTYEDAANYSAAERAEELAQRQADFDQSVKALSQMQKANGNAFANKNAFQQIAMLASLTLGGFVQGWRGGNNPAADAMKQWTDSELKAQELNFQMAKGTAQEKQTAFAMAMQKYGNVDAARAAARAAMMDSFQTELVQQSARWKGTEAANRAQMAAAALQDEKMAQIAAGIQFMPGRQVATGPTFVDPETGLTYNEAQARELAKEFRGHEHEMRKGAQGVAGDLMKEGVKADLSQGKDSRQQRVRLHTGEIVRAPSDTEAGKLRDISAGVQQAQSLVDEARKIREGKAWVIPGTKEHARLQTIQSELTLAFKDRGGLGALSGPDMGLANSATGDITSIRPGTDEKLKAFSDHTNKALRSRVGTYADATPSARGEMPASLVIHGQKK